MFKKYIVNRDDLKACNNYVHMAGFPGATNTDIVNKFLVYYNHLSMKNL